MLDQRLSTIPQHNWISKLFGYDFRVEYCPGRLNTAADALSRRDGEDITLAAVSSPSFQFFDDLRREIELSPDLRALRDDAVAGTRGDQWRVTEGLLLREGKVLLPASSPLLPAALQQAHTAGGRAEDTTASAQRLLRRAGSPAHP
jgi:hypothetical protein